jgi:N-methylhydantoinase B
LNPDTPAARELPSKITFQMAAGDVVSVQTPGGGGTEDPLERDPTRVAADVAQGKISPERARAVYGVVVDAVTQALDAAATTATRAEVSREARAPR